MLVNLAGEKLRRYWLLIMRNKGNEVKGWRRICEAYDVFDRLEESNEAIRLRFEDMGRIARREIRLLNNAFTDKSSAPQFMIERGVSPISVSRRECVLGHFDNYVELDYSDLRPVEVKVPSYIKTLRTRKITTEGELLGCISVCDILDDIFEGGRIKQTLFGKQGAGTHTIFVNNLYDDTTNYRVQLMNPQIEIDNCWESESCIVPAECKLSSNKKDSSPPTHLLIRQLFHPYQAVKTIIKPIDKRVTPIAVMGVSRDPLVVRIFRFEFKNDKYYNSINLVDTYDYVIRDHDYVSFV